MSAPRSPRGHWLGVVLRARGYTHTGLYWARGRVSVIVQPGTIGVTLLPGAGAEPEGWRITFHGAAPRPLVKLALDVAEGAEAERAEGVSAH